MCIRALASVMLLGMTAGLAACSDRGAASSDLPAQESDLHEEAGPDAADASAIDIDASADGGLDAGSTSYVDPRDGQTYPIMKRGGKTWLARNLSFAIAGSSFCYDDDPHNCASDGRLYPFTVARTACPPSWHLPTDDEWKSLETALGMPASELDLEGYSTVRGTNEGTKLKGSARMAGYRTGTTYDALGDRTYFWTASKRGADVWRRRVATDESTIFRFTNPPQGFAISVRCVMD